ncbi:MAG TPA: ABC transporter permease, partial [Thermotogales bacterium]|nr:ABC transporter permease [Thermotogales bacterium]
MMKIKVENFGREFTLGIVLIVLVSFVQFINHSFISVRTLNVILENSAVILPSAIGTTLVIIAGQIDLSVGSIFAVSAITSAQLALKGVPMFLVILWSIGIGAILGFLNGIITVTFRIPA